MWIRSAFWVGSVKPGHESQFRELMNHDVVPGLAALPGVRDVKALWPQRLEDSPPAVICQILVQFDSREDIDRMLASPERAAFRPHVLAVKALFEGAFSHIDYSVGMAT